MGKRACWAIIFIALVVNVVMLQWTLNAYVGRDPEYILVYTAVAVASAIITFITYLRWRKLEYKNG
ncbi:hypothetical protein [Desertibacillus haloalkaliphilus]|uniref:hypothetical protein n=1 Tax=Desertibacillus haloalkaliphilus TaxID=1328930 RepID=UPI001C2802FB|nr:hypothetical protein [Desertibacillus haloalkaliphilus]MBU8908319.1 hypothetical protein [Desertibacillus haloalkaliphilus]